MEDYEKIDLNEFLKSLSQEDIDSNSKWQTRLQSANEARSTPIPQFNNMNYIQYFESNEKIANTTHLEKRKNADDVIVSAGTVEAKLDSILSQINNLNLSAEVLAFDKENNKYAELAQSLEDIMHDCKIRDGADGAGDEEKRMLRQRELMKQGTVFVQQEWLTKWQTKKVLKNKKFDGKFKDWEGCTEELVKVFEGPSRSLLWGPSVLLGDITQFYMDNQPFVAVLKVATYQDAKSGFEKFENFKYVKPGPVDNKPASNSQTIYDATWRLTTISQNQVEIFICQDEPNDEFQVYINNIPMFPTGFPLSAVAPLGKYNIAKQVYRVLSTKLAYGGSFVSAGSVKEISALMDEMLRLMVLKTRKSFTPAYINTSGRVIDKKVLSPGRISMGIEEGALKPIAGNEVQGVTAGEANILTKFQDMIDKSTVSEQFTGQAGPAGTTATEANLLQQQARLTLGLTVAACSLLEQKLDYLLLYCLLENYFEPADSKVVYLDDARTTLVNVHRNITRSNVPIDGEGQGDRSIYVTEGELPDPKKVRESERSYKRRTGTPIRNIFIDRNQLKTSNLVWYIVIRAKERESSASFKMLFKEMLADMSQLIGIGSVPNLQGLEEEFSRVWNKPTAKLFASTQDTPPQLPSGPKPPGRSGSPAPSAVPSGLPAMDTNI